MVKLLAGAGLLHPHLAHDLLAMGVAGVLDTRLRVCESLVVAPFATGEVPPRHRVEPPEIHRCLALALRAIDLALYVGFALDHNVLDNVVAGGAFVIMEDGHLFLLQLFDLCSAKY